MLVYQKTMSDRYFCMNFFLSLENFGNPSKISFLYYYNGVQKHEEFVGFHS